MAKSLKEQLQAQKDAKAAETKTPEAAPTPPVADDTEARIAAEVEKRVQAALTKTSKTASSDPLEDKVTAAVAKAMAAVAPTLAKSMGEAIGQSLMAAEATKEMTAHQKRLEELRAKSAKEEKCHICGQMAGNGRTTGCGGAFKRNKNGSYVMEPVMNPDGSAALDENDKPIMRRIEDYEQFHEKMVVFPREAMALQCWDGVTINGKTYMSMGPGHAIWVPKVAKDTIMGHLSAYEVGERDARIPKKRSRHGGFVNGQTMGHTGPGVGQGWNTESAV